VFAQTTKSRISYSLFLTPKLFCVFGVVVAMVETQRSAGTTAAGGWLLKFFECAMLHQQGANDSHAPNAVSAGKEDVTLSGGELNWTPLNLAAPRQRAGMRRML
jgi:hypothetical protein